MLRTVEHQFDQSSEWCFADRPLTAAGVASGGVSALSACGRYPPLGTHPWREHGDRHLPAASAVNSDSTLGQRATWTDVSAVRAAMVPVVDVLLRATRRAGDGADRSAATTTHDDAVGRRGRCRSHVAVRRYRHWNTVQEALHVQRAGAIRSRTSCLYCYKRLLVFFLRRLLL